jgi:two-component system, OmpR family, response regulator QseB
MNSFIIVETGSPYEKGAFLSLDRPKTVVGRKTTDSHPDIPFNNIFVSRNHLEIFRKDEVFFIRDLHSKHGTFVNNRQLEPYQEIRLKDADKISIANGLIKFSISTSSMEKTADLSGCLQKGAVTIHAVLNPLTNELLVGEQSYDFSEKEYKCIELFVHQRDQFVTTEEIKRCVWQERIVSNDDPIPDVSLEEVNALIYRIRKKTRGILTIENYRGKGFVLTFTS